MKGANIFLDLQDFTAEMLQGILKRFLSWALNRHLNPTERVVFVQNYGLVINKRTSWYSLVVTGLTLQYSSWQYTLLLVGCDPPKKHEENR